MQTRWQVVHYVSFSLLSIPCDILLFIGPRKKYGFADYSSCYDVKYIWNNSYIWTAVVDQSEEWSSQYHQTPVSLDLCLRKTGAGKSRDYRDVIDFKKHFSNVFRPQENSKPAFSNFSGLKSVIGNLRFRDGLVWTVGLRWHKPLWTLAKRINTSFTYMHYINKLTLFFIPQRTLPKQIKVSW